MPTMRWSSPTVTWATSSVRRWRVQGAGEGRCRQQRLQHKGYRFRGIHLSGHDAQHNALLYPERALFLDEGLRHSRRGQELQGTCHTEHAEHRFRRCINACLRIKNLSDAEFCKSHYVVFCTKNGVIKKTCLTEYSRPRVNGVNAITDSRDERVIGSAV